MVQATSDVRGDRSIGPFDFNQSSTRWPYAAASSGGGRSHTQDSHRFPNAGPRPVARAGPRRDARSSSIYDRFAFSLNSLTAARRTPLGATTYGPSFGRISTAKPPQELPVTAWRHTTCHARPWNGLKRHVNRSSFWRHGHLHIYYSDVYRSPKIVHRVLC